MRRRFVPLTYTCVLRALWLGAFAIIAVAGCTSANDSESEVPAQPGAVQPETSGKPVAEDAACSQLTEAEAKARSGLKCDSVKRSCPDYIRPAAGEGCFDYDQGSISACIKLFDSFGSCDDFDAHPCLVTAVPASGCAGADGGAGGGLGEGGSGGALLGPEAVAGAGG
jgi:hypothetical protein